MYGRGAALSNLSFSLPAASILGVVGANGAGKSTLFDILATLDHKFEGEVKVAGYNIKREQRAIRPMVGYLPGQFSLYRELTVIENIKFYAKMYGSSIDSLHKIEIWDSLREFSNFRGDQLSGGMQQKLSLLCALIHSPSLLLLDEPTTGIDVESRKLIQREFLRLKSEGVTTIVSTHYYEEFASFDYLLLLHKGKRLFFRTKEEMAVPENNSAHFFENYIYNEIVKFEELEGE